LGIKKKLKNGTLDGFPRPRPAFVASTTELPEQRHGELKRFRSSRNGGEVISDRVIELNPTTVDSRTDQEVVGVVSDWNASKWRSYSP